MQKGKTLLILLYTILVVCSAVYASGNNVNAVDSALSHKSWCESHPEKCEKLRKERQERHHEWCLKNPKACEKTGKNP
jgi:hypothetical protein